MKKIKFELNELETCFISLAHMFSNSQAREEYKLLQLDVKIEYPSNELDIISSIVTNYSNDESMLTNFEVVKELRELEKYWR